MSSTLQAAEYPAAGNGCVEDAAIGTGPAKSHAAAFGPDSGFTPEQLKAGLSIPVVEAAAFADGQPPPIWHRLWRKLRFPVALTGS